MASLVIVVVQIVVILNFFSSSLNLTHSVIISASVCLAYPTEDALIYSFSRHHIWNIALLEKAAASVPDPVR